MLTSDPVYSTHPFHKRVFLIDGVCRFSSRDTQRVQYVVVFWFKQFRQFFQRETFRFRHEEKDEQRRQQTNARVKPVKAMCSNGKLGGNNGK